MTAVGLRGKSFGKSLEEKSRRRKEAKEEGKKRESHSPAPAF